MNTNVRCWGKSTMEGCFKEGKVNFNLFGTDGITYPYFLCPSHKEQGVLYWERSRFKFERIEPKHTCGLIVCKECLNNLDEVLDY